MIQEAQEEILFSVDEQEDSEDYDTVDFSRIFFSSAVAEEESGMETTDEEDPFTNMNKLTIPDNWALPWDFSVPPVPDPECYTEDGYKDQSIHVRIEIREMCEQPLPTV